MRTTCELRWFSGGRWGASAEGLDLGPLERWFGASQERVGDVSIDERTDFYLYLPGCKTLGVKYREGMIETKERQGDAPSTVAARRGSVGRMETWVKVGSKVAGPGLEARIAADPWPEGCWVKVEKVRTSLSFKVAIKGDPAQPDLAVEQIPVNDRTAPDVCNVEWTRLNVIGRSWWTVGFEAVGQDPDRQATLLTVLAHVTASWDFDGRFAADHSYGYPEWLDAILEP